jgi:valyl-tRNA synthetase
MSIPKTYDPTAIETKWYELWQEKGFFHSEPDERDAYSIVMPPPNVTGILHMGHALNNTVQDVLIRKARMEGKNACWIPGTDHASIATEAKVVAWLKDQGIDKSSLSRDKFIEYCWEWTKKYGGIILEQLKKMGASCDWERTHFTMDPEYYKAVIYVFTDLYKDGYIYRGEKMINWDPQAKTALSDEEVIFKEKTSRLYYISYKVEDSDDTITIATTRPETLLGDTAVCVHPDDQRYADFVGRKVIVPLVNRPVPVIADDYVETDFGTGALKVTPAHDKNDYELGLKHNLSIIDIFNEDGTLSSQAGIFIGKDRFEARKLIVKALEDAELLVKVEEIQNSVGFSERTDAVIEPRLSKQWFCRMEDLAEPALDAVMADEIEFYPAKFKNVYRHWMENIHDWCISRQLWWGHRIPAWYLQDGSIFVAETAEEALDLAKEETENPNLTLQDLRQDDDVLDTWFSSWLWPIAVFKGVLQPNNYDIRYYYPTDVLVTAPEIIFFWVARMIMAGFEYRHVEPFEQVYFTGIVRDKQGRKMSKSLGNSPDLIELINKYGADGVRFGILVASPAGNDLLFDEKLCEQGRNFSNKIWNAMRLVKGWETNEQVVNNAALYCDEPVEWFENRLLQVLVEIEDFYEEFRLSEVLTTIYKLVWDDFCATYLEMIKPGAEGIDYQTFSRTLGFFEDLMKLVHPFMPFLTEEIWHTLKERGPEDFCIIAPYPESDLPDKEVLADANKVIELITQIRNFRNNNGISPKEQVDLYIKTSSDYIYHDWEYIIRKMANINQYQFTNSSIENSISFSVKTDTFFIPQPKELNTEFEKSKILEELEYTRGFLITVNAKLNNERFIQHAKPEIIDKEKQKKEDAEARIKMLEEYLNRLS